MTTPEQINIALCELRSCKTRAGKEPYAEITIRVPLGEAWERAAPFLARVINDAHPVNVEIAEVQARLKAL